MSRKLIAIATLLMLGSGSAAMAQGAGGDFDPDLANRYPAYANPIPAQPHGAWDAPAALRQQDIRTYDHYGQHR